MAVPKKRCSKRKKNMRKTSWKNKLNKKTKLAFSIAKAVLGKNKTSFIYSLE
jgi:hypothetical protein